MFLGLQYKLWFDKEARCRAHSLEQELSELKTKNEDASRRMPLEADVRDLEKGRQ